jgi:dTMP kinase
VSERVRELVKDPSLQVGPRAEALLYAAARAQLVDEAIDPLLAAGSWVLLDRFVDSSLAYQGAGRELGIAPVRAINEFATGDLRPDRTLLLVLDPALGRSRSQARAEPVDRLEREDDQFFARIASAYQQLAAEDPARIRLLDATRPPDRVRDAALAELSDLL